MKQTLIAINFLFFVAITTKAFPSNDKGNGGDGVILKDGSVVLYDYFERSVSADKSWAKLWADNRERHWNYSLERMLESQKSSRWGGPFWAGQLGKKTMRDLVVLLEHVAYRYPALVAALVSEMGKLEWVAAPIDLAPNEDTNTPLEPTQMKRIGCARNEDGIILYSPTCASEAMSSANKAGLVIHEAFYSLLKKKHPEVSTSFQVRSFSKAMITSGIFTKLDLISDVLELSKMNEILFTDAEIGKVFFNGQRHKSSTIHCSFGNQTLRDLNLTFKGAYSMRGTLDVDVPKERLKEIGYTGKTLSQIWGNTSPEDYGVSSNPLLSFEGWLSDEPVFDLAKKIMVLYMRSQDERIVELKIHYDASKTIEATYWLYPEEESPERLTGSCSQLY